MTGKTHLVVGTALASGLLLLNHNTSNSEIITTSIILSALGAILPDIDIEHSLMRKVFYGTILAIGIMIELIFYSNINPKSLINWNEVTVPIIIGACGFIGLLMYGYFSSHRTFTHTLLALILFSLSIYMICNNLAYTMYFAIGMLSHQLLDMLNKKSMYWLNPITKKDFALYSINSSGTTSTMMFVVGLLVTICFTNQLSI